MQPYTIQYRFTMKDSSVLEFAVQLDPETLLDRAPLPDPCPDWTRLENQRCANCTLEPAAHRACPSAARVSPLVSAFARTSSNAPALVQVTVPERESSKETTVQAGLSSLMGIHMATSGCPVLARLRPMARFHVPFATPLETLFRSAGNYLLGQLVRGEEAATGGLEGLEELYRDIAQVNSAFARRLRTVQSEDANLNALVVLDAFAKSGSGELSDPLERLRPLFEKSWK